MALSTILLYIGGSRPGIVATVALGSLSVGLSMFPEGAFRSTAIRIVGKQALRAAS